MFDIVVAVNRGGANQFFIAVSGKSGMLLWHLSVKSECAHKDLFFLVNEFNHNLPGCLTPDGKPDYKVPAFNIMS